MEMVIRANSMRHLRPALFIGLVVASFAMVVPSIAAPPATAPNDSTTQSATSTTSSTATDTRAVQAVQQVDTETVTGDGAANKNSSQDGTYEQAIVTGVKSISQQTPNGAQQLKTYDVEFLSGPLQGKNRTLSSDVSSNPYGLDPTTGDKIVVFLQPDPNGGEPLPFLQSFDRRGAIYWLLALFVATLVLLAGWQGFKIAFSILLSVLLIGIVLIPAFLHGLDPVMIAMVLVVLLATLSAVLSIGWNKKSAVTVIGTLGGVLVAYLISLIFTNWAHLSGLSTDDDRLFFEKNPLLKPQGLLFAGIIIAAMGVVEDVAVSIASGVMEVRQANTQLGFKELFRSGMVIGRDHMGALANTLVFAYVGGSLSTLLLYTQYGGSWAKFINFDSVVDEIIRSLAGTIGLVFTVPITALLAAWFALRIKEQISPIRKAGGWHGDHQH